MTLRPTAAWRALPISSTRSARPLPACARAPRTHRVGLVVVPTRGAAQQLQGTLQNAQGAAADARVTRADVRPAARASADPPRRLTAFERDVIAQAAAGTRPRRHPALPFRLRPGSDRRDSPLLRSAAPAVAQVQRFEELIEQQLLGARGIDPGADRMLQQTRFLAETFREYERRARALGRRGRAHAARAPDRRTASPDRAARHRAVPDWIADPDGLFVADFDLLTRLPGLEALDLVSHRRVLGSGFHERLHSWLPGLEEVAASGGPARRPTLITPHGPAAALWFTDRDREEELIAVARRITSGPGSGGGRTMHPMRGTAHRSGGVAQRGRLHRRRAGDRSHRRGVQTAAAVPLSGRRHSWQPRASRFRFSTRCRSPPSRRAAALDLVLDRRESRFHASAIVALLRSPHFVVRERAASTVTNRARSIAR